METPWRRKVDKWPGLLSHCSPWKDHFQHLNIKVPGKQNCDLILIGLIGQLSWDFPKKQRIKSPLIVFSKGENDRNKTVSAQIEQLQCWIDGDLPPHFKLNNIFHIFKHKDPGYIIVIENNYRTRIEYSENEDRFYIPRCAFAIHS